ncbi:short-chain dehydrogenase/reductase SDR [Acidithiobacillus ferrivorans SS3]|uniref:Short-chain dehydrogenase/reductase SDR n=1 Tax=Acidithiobacillus ferrivorans SS3 TaxID=743299 RepID=G0JUC0_9PROT|nr:SDR family oxidoreductase [Acidithiobacillus ferrivorans]AEM49089.1 short-chain dehydrogenase/reductase SDR [Acidithiobacillus ferrivorans SS3]
MRHILIIGATSAIAEATARHFAHNGDRLYLVARNQERLAAMASDLKTRGATQVETMVLDANDTTKHADLISQAETTMGGLDTILVAHGTLSDQKACEASFDETLKELQTNCLSVISLLTHIANRFEEQKHGTIVVISSVAGDRGRQSNYVYGTAKAAVTTFLQGLRNRLYRSGVTVITIKPGFVDTPMTASFRKGALWASAYQIGDGIYRAIQRKRNVVYLPWFWKFIMVIIQLIPERFFKKMKL